MMLRYGSQALVEPVGTLADFDLPIPGGFWVPANSLTRSLSPEGYGVKRETLIRMPVQRIGNTKWKPK